MDSEPAAADPESGYADENDTDGMVWRLATGSTVGATVAASACFDLSVALDCDAGRTSWWPAAQGVPLGSAVATLVSCERPTPEPESVSTEELPRGGLDANDMLGGEADGRAGLLTAFSDSLRETIPVAPVDLVVPVPTGTAAASVARRGIDLGFIRDDDGIRLLRSSDEVLEDAGFAAADPDPDQAAASCVSNNCAFGPDEAAAGNERDVELRLAASGEPVICVRLVADMDVSLTLEGVQGPDHPLVSSGSPYGVPVKCSNGLNCPAIPACRQ